MRTVVPVLILGGCLHRAQSRPAPVLATPLTPVALAPPVVAEPLQQLRRVYYDFDSAALTPTARSVLEANAALLSAHPEVHIELQGHADERGTAAYNLDLGLLRAQNAAAALHARGVSPDRIQIVSYGEDRPLRSGGYEAAWSQNRRCEFVVTQPAGAPLNGTQKR